MNLLHHFTLLPVGGQIASECCRCSCLPSCAHVDVRRCVDGVCHDNCIAMPLRITLPSVDFAPVVASMADESKSAGQISADHGTSSLPCAVAVTAQVTTASGAVARANLASPLDLSIPARPYAQPTDRVRTFHLPLEDAPAAQFGDTRIAVDDGCAVNCPVMSVSFHSSCTHTECVGHMLPGKVTLGAIPRRSYVNQLLEVWA